MSEEEKTITVKKSDLWKYATFLLLAVVIIGGFFLLRNDGSSGNTNTDTTDTGTNDQAPINAKALIENNDPVLGNADAGITILEFSDFQCPFCERAYSGAIADFKASSYFTNGEVNLIYKQFPLNSIHPYAQKAAEASLCAGEQGKFWEMHDMMFENQAKLTVTDLNGYASQLGLNTAQFNACLDNGKFASEVSKETAQATSAGGQGTPFFVIVNTETDKSTVISGAYPWTQFEAAIASIK
ncbi:DsbA family protein [Candidatus Pacearchaeota archaeon]|nr:DsbA family protein [Candidatus Pacearchaeota archaeon]